MAGKPIIKSLALESVLIIFTIILLMVVGIVLVHNIRSVNRDQIAPHHPPMISDFLLKNKQENKTTVADVDKIDVWMTFQYVNFIFNLPEPYLKDRLTIKDVKYPNLSFARYIKNEKLDKAKFISEIQGLVREYMTLHPTNPIK